jgi:hypothetical protein
VIDTGRRILNGIELFDLFATASFGKYGHIVPLGGTPMIVGQIPLNE